MASFVPSSFSDAWEKGKGQFNEYKKPVTNLFKNDQGATKLNDGATDGYQSGSAPTNQAHNNHEYDNSKLQVHSNPILRIHEFNWTREELSVMESSFFYGYLVTQIPAGFLAAKLFGIGIGIGSTLNIFLPYGFKSKSDTLVAVIQIVQGLAQGFCYPAMHGVWRYWAPPMERSKLATTAFTGSYAGAVLGLPLSAFLVSYVSWGSPFYLYGFCGMIWTILWFSLSFEKPACHPTISQEEKKFIEDAIGHVSSSHPTLKSIPWKAILTSKPVWAIIVANFARSWTFYLLLQNQLTYMKEALGMRINDSGLVAALPHAVMGLIVLFGGQLADYLRSNKILSTTAVRKIFNCGGFGGEAAFMLIVAYTNKESTAIIALILAVGCSGFAISGFNVNHLDIAPRYAAILMGFSNGIGTLAGLTCPFVTEYFTANGAHGWTKVFLLASLIHFTGVTFYAVYASGELQDWAEPKEEEEPWNQQDGNTATGLLKNNGTTGYGTAKQESLGMTPIAGSGTQDNLGRNMTMAPAGTNPFAPAWDDGSNSQVAANPHYQDW
ncbi:hypothetical protein WR25_04805 [Diploscapter pachys]|uniref:Major facilitator superfamily (MFS) profile domain-containing protein n=1 Tax=Diploscapter pachys TaxID=2018661 RepID=A0A2A2LNF4_9BILA|nr:hypothetical protein WR25_04805 [Diploscapter pachys]